MNWIKQLVITVVIAMMFVYSFFGLMNWALTAHAQKPEPSAKDVPLIARDGKDILGPWIEQHCVAVWSRKFTNMEPMYDYNEPLKLRCQ